MLYSNVFKRFVSWPHKSLLIVVNDIIEAHCYSFQMIGSDNEQSRSRLTDGIFAKMYDVSNAKVFIRYKTVLLIFCNYSIC